MSDEIRHFKTGDLDRIPVQRHPRGKQQKARSRHPFPISTGPNLTRRPHNFRDHKAKPITPPQRVGVHRSYRCIIDYGHRPFSILWSGSPEYPDFTKFPFLKKVKVSRIYLNTEIAAIWRNSTIFDYGAHASIRITEQNRFPIIKLAHSDDLSLKLIQHEFDILAVLTKLGLPVVAFDQEPIQSNGVICGYRMRQLSKLELSEFHTRTDEIKQALDRFHSAAFSHGDFGPSNLMKDEGNNIILIDYSFTGRLGSVVPSFFPSWVYTGGLYNVNADLTAFDRYREPI